MTAHVNVLNRVQATVRNSIRLAIKASHNGFALLGLALAFVVIGLSAQPELRRSLEFKATAWLQERQFAFLGMEARADAVDRATAVDPKDLPRQQAAVAYWLSTKYRVAPEPLAALVAEAYQISAKAKVEPVLLLAIMAIESGFNPFAQSPMGAQGLMQVMTKVHVDKYEGFGGAHAAFDPVTNLRVGARVLEDCISRRGGSSEGGLRCYVGATSTISDGGYVNRVMAEFNRLKQVANGKSVPTTAPVLQVAAITPTPVAVPVTVTPAAAVVSPSTLPAPKAEKPAAKPAAEESSLPAAKAPPQAKAVQVASRDTASDQKTTKPQTTGLNARGIPDAIAPFMMMAPPAETPTAKPGSLDKTKLASSRVS